MPACSEILGFYQVDILVAVAAVGPEHQDVRRYLAGEVLLLEPRARRRR